MNIFKTAAPNEVGVLPSGVLNFLDIIEKQAIELHSLMIIRHNKICVQGWWKPYSEQQQHAMYSFSKSLTSTAVGFACQEGILSLDERLVDIFPNEVNSSESFKEIKIKHLLNMSCGHETEPEGSKKDWISDFLKHKLEHKPGTAFRYNTPGVNLLCAILKKRTGISLTKYLEPRLFAPLKIEGATCGELTDKTQAGGGGFSLKTGDMAKFAMFVLQKGQYGGKQLLNSAWFDEACSKQIEVQDSDINQNVWFDGYGYLYWICSKPLFFAAAGAYGQYGLIYPDKEMIIIVTAATERTHIIIDAIQNTIMPLLSDKPIKEDGGEQKRLEARLKGLKLKALFGERNPIMEQSLSRSDAVYYTREKCPGLKLLIGGAGLYNLNDDAYITGMRFNFKDSFMVWTLFNVGGDKKIFIGLDDSYKPSLIDKSTYMGTGRWRSYNCMEIEVRNIQAISGTRFILRFKNGRLKIEADPTIITSTALGVWDTKIPDFYMAARL